MLLCRRRVRLLHGRHSSARNRHRRGNRPSERLNVVAALLQSHKAAIKQSMVSRPGISSGCRAAIPTPSSHLPCVHAELREGGTDLKTCILTALAAMLITGCAPNGFEKFYRPSRLAPNVHLEPFSGERGIYTYSENPKADIFH